MFTRGYSEVRQKRGKGKYVATCFSCIHFYQEVGDEEELCQHPSVLPYDMQTTDDNRVFCHYWKGTDDEVERKKEGKKTIFKSRKKDS